VIRRHADVRFLTTAELADAMSSPDNPLLLQGARLRLAIFLRRVLAAPSLSRRLKLTGLRLVLPIVARMLRRT